MHTGTQGRWPRGCSSVYKVCLWRWLASLLFLGILATTKGRVPDCNLWVSPQGSDGTGCGLHHSPCATIQSAVENSGEGQTICVEAATYGCPTEGVQVNRSVNIFSLNGTAVINCDGKGRAFWVRSGSFWLAGFDVMSGKVTGSNGGAILTQTPGRILIERCNFSRHSAGDGGAIYSEIYGNTTLVVRDSIFLYNYGSINGGAVYLDGFLHSGPASEVLLDGVRFERNGVKGGGGGFYYNGTGLLSVIGCNFTNNMAYGGGAANIFTSDNGRVSLSGCLFDSNNGTVGGAGISFYFASATWLDLSFNRFIGNRAAFDPSIGAVCFLFAPIAHGLNISIIGNDLFDNSVVGYGGGMTFGANPGCYLTGSEITIANNTFKTNKATSGGGLFMSLDLCNSVSGNRFNFLHNIFLNNTAVGGSGGALGLTFSEAAGNWFRFHDNLFTLNSASNYGGGIAVTFASSINSHLDFIDGSFTDNSANQQLGGGLYLNATSQRSSEVLLRGVKFTRNVASRANGGGLYLTGLAQIELDGCLFHQNSAVGGSGMCVFPSGNGNILTTSCRFLSNNSTGGVGALSLISSSGVSMNLSGNIFEDNTGYGAPPYVAAVDIELLPPSTSGMSLVFAGNNLTNNWGAGDGGGLGIWASPAAISRSTFRVVGNVFTSNSALAGGGMILWLLDSLLMKENLFYVLDNIFINNTARLFSGGGLAIGVSSLPSSQGNRLWFSGNRVESNFASARGGGMMALGAGFIVDTTDCSFYGNTGVEGGGMWVNATSLSLQTSRFVNNVASVGGGGLWAESISYSSIDIHGCNFTGNSGGGTLNVAGGGGACIHSSSDQATNAMVTVKGNGFLSNTANGGGGGVMVRLASNIVIRDNQYQFVGNLFTNNTVGPLGDGGGLCWYQDPSASPSCSILNNTILLATNVFNGNSALSGGGLSIEYDVEGTEALAANNIHLLHGDEFNGNMATQKQGGAVSIQFPPDSFNCKADSQGSRTWNYSGNVNRLEGIRFTNNSSPCQVCVGGGLSLGSGQTVVTNSTFEGNTVGFLELGRAIGIVADSTSVSILYSQFLNGTEPQDQTLYSFAGGDLSIDANTTFIIRSSDPFIRVPQGGVSSFSLKSVKCHSGFLHSDTHVTHDYVPECKRRMSANSISFWCLESCDIYHYILPGGKHCENCSTAEMICYGNSTVLSLPGFWCGANQDHPTRLDCIACPHGYCDETGATEYRSSCIGNRKGTLCGECLPGYGEAFGTYQCLPDDECDDAAWFVPVALVVGLLYVALMVWVQIAHHPLWKSVTYFMQVAPLVAMAITEENASDNVSGMLVRNVFAVFSFDPSILGLPRFHACPIRGLTAVGKMASGYLVPIVLLIELALMLGGHLLLRLGWRTLSRWRPLHRLIGCFKARLSTDSSSNEEDEDLLPDEDDSDPSVSENSPINTLSDYSRYATALMGLLLLLYEGTTSATMDLLHCVEVGGMRRVFRAGYHECTPFYPLFLLLGIFLVPFPLALIGLRWVIRNRSSLAQHSAGQAVLRILEAPYRKRRQWWESVGLLRRLTLLSLATFVLHPVWRSVSLFLACFVGLLSHLYCRPFAVAYHGRVEALFLGDLSLIAALEIPKSVFLFLGKEDPDQTTTVLSYIEDVLILLPLVYCVAVVIYVVGKRWLFWKRGPAVTDREMDYPNLESRMSSDDEEEHGNKYSREE